MLRLFRRHDAFTLTEILVTLALCVTALTVFYAAAGQAIRLVRAGKETASATQLLQQRMESFHSKRLWTDGISPEDLKSLVASQQPAVVNLPGAEESYTVTDYPSGTSMFTVTRGSDGTITTSGSAFSDSQKCVKVEGRITWTGVWKISRAHIQSTILSRGGLVVSR